MARKGIWLLLAIVGSMAWCNLCLAQPMQVASAAVRFPVYLERLGDRDLQKLSGHGGVQPQPQTEQPVAAIKLWDEWAKPMQTGSLNEGGYNRVTVSGPHK
jgi:hypothetical protein